MFPVRESKGRHQCAHWCKNSPVDITGPRKDEWSLWGEEEQGLRVDVLRRRTEHCSLRSDEGRGRFPPVSERSP